MTVLFTPIKLLFFVLRWIVAGSSLVKFSRFKEDVESFEVFFNATPTHRSVYSVAVAFVPSIIFSYRSLPSFLLLRSRRNPWVKLSTANTRLRIVTQQSPSSASLWERSRFDLWFALTCSTELYKLIDFAIEHCRARYPTYSFYRFIQNKDIIQFLLKPIRKFNAWWLWRLVYLG